MLPDTYNYKKTKPYNHIWVYVTLDEKAMQKDAVLCFTALFFSIKIQ